MRILEHVKMDLYKKYISESSQNFSIRLVNDEEKYNLIMMELKEDKVCYSYSHYLTFEGEEAIKKILENNQELGIITSNQKVIAITDPIERLDGWVSFLEDEEKKEIFITHLINSMPSYQDNFNKLMNLVLDKKKGWKIYGIVTPRNRYAIETYERFGFKDKIYLKKVKKI